MGATSVTGKGNGSVESFSTQGLHVQELNQINIIYSGRASSAGPVLSPSSYAGTVVFSSPLTGAANNYNVIITSIGGGFSYVADFTESGGNFVGFTFITEYESEIMYIVCKNVE